MIQEDLIGANAQPRDTSYDKVTKSLKEKCFNFFSIGDVYEYYGTKYLQLAKAAPSESSEREKQTKCAVRELCEAAKYWRSKGDVESDGLEMCPLERHCEDLLLLGKVGQEGVVSVCITAAKCFNGDDSATPRVLLSSRPRDWEENLYHGGSVNDPQTCCELSKACYRRLIANIEKVNDSVGLGGGVRRNDSIQSSRNASIMIYQAVDLTKDPIFHNELYEFLDKKNWDDCLLGLNTEHVENFLRERQETDPLKLFNYFNRHGRYNDAVEFMRDRACTENELDIDSRVEVSLPLTQRELYTQFILAPFVNPPPRPPSFLSELLVRYSTVLSKCHAECRYGSQVYEENKILPHYFQS